MYRGIRLDDCNVSSYETALAALHQRAKRSRKVKQAEVNLPGGDEAPLGHPRSEVSGIRMDHGENIRFRLYRTDVVTWHPDNSVTIDGYPSVTTGAFANMLLPRGMYLNPIARTMSLYSPESQYRWKDQRVCRDDGTYRQVDGMWEPEDPAPLVFHKLDRKAARAVAKEHSLADFKRFMSIAPFTMELHHEGCDVDAAADALLERDFRTAAEHLPLTETGKSSFGRDIKPLPFQNTRWDRGVTAGSIETLRAALYMKAGVYRREEFGIMTSGAYEARKALERKVEKVRYL
jgi:hypothetical protein